MGEDRNEAGPHEAAELLRRLPPGRCLGFVGPSGSGRTTLLDTGAPPDAIRMRGRADETEHPLLAASPLVGESGTDLPTLLDTARHHLGEDGVLVVDDIDMLDAASLSLVSAVAARARDWGVSVIVCGQHLPSDWPGQIVALAPFIRGAARVASALCVTPDELDRVIDETGGLPRWVAAAVTGTLQREVDTRLATLSAPARIAAQALAWGASVSDDSGAAATSLTVDQLDTAMIELAAEGFGSPPPPAIAAAVRHSTPSAARHAIVDALLRHSPASRAADLAGWLDEVGDRTGRAGAVYAAAGVELRPVDLDAACRMFEAAAASGALARDHRVRFASTRLAAGAPDQALAILHELADESRDPAVLATSAAALARHGRAGDARHVIEELLAVSEDADGIELAPLYDAGQGGGAAAGGSPVGTRAVAARFAASAATWMNEGQSALLSFADAAHAAADLPDVREWPWHPLDLLTAASTLERRFDVVEETLDRLRATDATAAAREALARLRGSRTVELAEPADAGTHRAGLRHACLIHAVAAGAALRRQQSETLEAMSIDTRPPALQPDLWSTDVICELAMVASRTGGVDAADQLLGPLDHLAARHGTGSTIARTLRWTRLIVGVLTDDAATVAAAAAALEAGPDSLEQRAARVFAAVFAGGVDPGQVEAMAAELRDGGLGFEASQLTGSAALRSTDEAATRDLLALSRQLRNERRQSAGGRSGDVEALSDREIEVARLVVLGRTHKEIGAELFISAKTVEHHVARVRRKLGATTRAEMMAAIRDYLDRHASVD